jgi:sulfur carrier protein
MTAPMNTAPLTIHTDRGAFHLPQGSTLADAVTALLQAEARHPDDAAALATAVNGEFVARGARNHHTLRDGDTVLCFAPITGG